MAGRFNLGNRQNNGFETVRYGVQTVTGGGGSRGAVRANNGNGAAERIKRAMSFGPGKQKRGSRGNRAW